MFWWEPRLIVGAQPGFFLSGRRWATEVPVRVYRLTSPIDAGGCRGRQCRKRALVSSKPSRVTCWPSAASMMSEMTFINNVSVKCPARYTDQMFLYLFGNDLLDDFWNEWQSCSHSGILCPSLMKGYRVVVHLLEILINRDSYDQGCVERGSGCGFRHPTRRQCCVWHSKPLHLLDQLKHEYGFGR